MRQHYLDATSLLDFSEDNPQSKVSPVAPILSAKELVGPTLEERITAICEATEKKHKELQSKNGPSGTLNSGRDNRIKNLESGKYIELLSNAQNLREFLLQILDRNQPLIIHPESKEWENMKALRAMGIVEKALSRNKKYQMGLESELFFYQRVNGSCSGSFDAHKFEINHGLRAHYRELLKEIDTNEG